MSTSAQPDISVFDAVPTQLLDSDKHSLLVLRQLVGRRFGDYAYLEVGSHLGGSLQPFLVDPRCTVVYSVDPRPSLQPDERGDRYAYPGNSTQRMLDTLQPVYGPQLAKLRCFERHADDLARDEVPVAPRLCFIDGEHTDAAAARDFGACLALAAADSVIVFDDSHLIYRAVRRCTGELEAAGVRYRAYVLPAKLAVIEVGAPLLWQEPELAERLATPDAYLHATDDLDRYRRMVLAAKRVPGVRTLRRVWAKHRPPRVARPEARPR